MSDLSNLLKVLEEIKYSDPQSLLLSRKDCHTINVDSIVLARNCEKLVRMFIAWPDHELYENSEPPFSVGVHDHKYDICLERIAGEIYNEEYEVVNQGGYRLNKYGFTGGCGDCSIYFIGKENIALKDNYPINMNDIPHDSLHTIYVRRNKPAAWKVYEGETRKQTTSLYCHEEPCLDGLYGTFATKHEIVERFERFIDLFQSHQNDA